VDDPARRTAQARPGRSGAGRPGAVGRRTARRARGRARRHRHRAGRPRRGARRRPQAHAGGRLGARPASHAGGAVRVTVDAARAAAYEAVEAVHRDGAYANLVLPRLLRERRVAGRDAAFATELTYGALRLTGTLDAIIASAAGRDVARVDPNVRDALRLGAYQLL